jgi:hypothetical protein
MLYKKDALHTEQIYMTTSKNPSSFRLSPEALELIGKLAEHLGISKTSVVEMAVRQLSRREMADRPGKRPVPPKKK